MIPGFIEHIVQINNPKHREQFHQLLEWVETEFPELDQEVKWNQPMFLHHGTFIIAFSFAKNHISVAPERLGIVTFEEEFKTRGISYSKMLFKFSFGTPIDYDILHKVLSFNLEDKKDYTKFWR